MVLSAVTSLCIYHHFFSFFFHVTQTWLHIAYESRLCRGGCISQTIMQNIYISFFKNDMVRQDCSTVIQQHQRQIPFKFCKPSFELYLNKRQWLVMTRIIRNLTQTMLNGSNPIRNIGLLFFLFFLKRKKHNWTQQYVSAVTNQAVQFQEPF